MRWQHLVIGLFLVPLQASADEHDDHRRALRALERGDVLPLATLIRVVEDRFDARIIEVELEEDEGRYIYEFELITPAGSILEVEVEARTGMVLEVEEEDD